MLHSSWKTDPIEGHLGVDGRHPGAIWEHFGSQMGGGKPCENDGGVIKITLLDICSLPSDMSAVLVAICRFFRARAERAGLRPIAEGSQADRRRVSSRYVSGP